MGVGASISVVVGVVVIVTVNIVIAAANIGVVIVGDYVGGTVDVVGFGVVTGISLLLLL